MWTAANRKSYERKGLRYPSDMTEAEWALAKSLVDVPQRGQGRRRVVDLREVLHAVFYQTEFRFGKEPSAGSSLAAA